MFAGLLCILVSAAAGQQPGQQQAATDTRGRELSTLCKKFTETSAPCEEYIRKYYGPKSDLIVGTLNAIDHQKDRARDEATYYKHWDRVLSGSLIVLAFLTTLSAALSRTYRDEQKYPLELRNFLGLLPIVMSALVTLGATFNSYYKFDQSRSQNTVVADELAKLQTTINFELIKQVSATDKPTVDIGLEAIGGWRDRLDAIMANYRSSDGERKKK
jgi:hypothetical protein